MVSTKERHILFINGKNDWSYFLTEINFNINFPKKKKKFLRNILIWIIKKILFKLNFLCIFWVQKKNKYKSYENFEEKNKKHLYKKNFSNFNKRIALEFIKNLIKKNSESQRTFVLKRKFCKKKLVFWEIFVKIKNIFPIYTFFLDQYDESSLERFQSLEFMSQSFFFFETTKKNFAFLKIFEFIRNIISFFLSNFPTERFLFQYFNEYLRPFLIFLAKIFRKPRFNQRTKVYENFLLRNQIILPSFYDKNFWYELLMKIISPKKQILKIFPSFKHGWGIFCQKKNIPSMTILTEYRGESQKILNLNQIEIFYRFLRKDLFLFKLNEQKTIDATYKGNMGRLINHSCNPNCFSKIINHAGKNHILIITHMNLKNIDEIDYDYRINSDDHDFEQILCNCDTFFCRRKLSL